MIKHVKYMQISQISSMPGVNKMSFTELKHIICDKCGHEYTTDSIRKSCPLCAVIHIEPLIKDVCDEEGNGYTIVISNPTPEQIEEDKLSKLPRGYERFDAEYYTLDEFNRMKAYVNTLPKETRKIKILALTNKQLWDIIRGE